MDSAGLLDRRLDLVMVASSLVLVERGSDQLMVGEILNLDLLLKASRVPAGLIAKLLAERFAAGNKLLSCFGWCAVVAS